MNNHSEMNIYQLIEECGTKIRNGVNRKAILKTETMLMRKLPAEYISLITYTNGVEIYGGDIVIYPIYDISENISIRETIGYLNGPQNKTKGSIPKNHLIIGKYNFGDYLCIDNETGRVIEWSHDTDEAFLEYESLTEFLSSTVEEHLD